MPDICDDAQLAEAMIRAQALASVSVLDTGPGPQIINGTLCCVDCDEEIHPARLAARPGCSRCTRCQEEAERDE